MKRKNKKISIKKIIIISIIVLTIGTIAFGVYTRNKNNKNGVFSILEKRWIEKNVSKVIDIGIINDLPLFGDEGDGVFFDFVNDFEKETNLKANLIPYSSNKTLSESK